MEAPSDPRALGSRRWHGPAVAVLLLALGLGTAATYDALRSPADRLAAIDAVAFVHSQPDGDEREVVGVDLRRGTDLATATAVVADVRRTVGDVIIGMPARDGSARAVAAGHADLAPGTVAEVLLALSDVPGSVNLVASGDLDAGGTLEGAVGGSRRTGPTDAAVLRVAAALADDPVLAERIGVLELGYVASLSRSCGTPGETMTWAELAPRALAIAEVVDRPGALVATAFAADGCDHWLVEVEVDGPTTAAAVAQAAAEAEALAGDRVVTVAP
ncbi:MAG TPA: hypothetical protein VGE77_08990 [Nocardioides sp.]